MNVFVVVVDDDGSELYGSAGFTSVLVVVERSTVVAGTGVSGVGDDAGVGAGADAGAGVVTTVGAGVC